MVLFKYCNFNIFYEVGRFGATKTNGKITLLTNHISVCTFVSVRDSFTIWFDEKMFGFSLKFRNKYLDTKSTFHQRLSFNIVFILAFCSVNNTCCSLCTFDAATSDQGTVSRIRRGKGESLLPRYSHQ